jgi:hypothetical protein
MTEQRPFTALAERLHADRSGALQQDLIQQLTRLREGLLMRSRQLQSRETYRELQGALKATEAGLSLLKMTIRREA